MDYLKTVDQRRHREDTPIPLPSPSQLWGFALPITTLAVGDLGPVSKSQELVVCVGRSWLGTSQHPPIYPTPTWWTAANSDKYSKMANVFFG